MSNIEETEVGQRVSEAGLTWKERVPLFHNLSRATCGTTEGNAAPDSGAKPGRDAEDMLIRAWRQPLTQTDLYRTLGVSGYRGNKTKQDLVRLGLAYEVKLPTNRRGRQKVLLEVTPKGMAYLAQLGVLKGARDRGRGSARHRYYQAAVKQWYEAHGYVAETEAVVGDGSVDVLVIGRDGTRLGLEVALSEQYEVVHAVKGLGAGIERLLFLVESEAMMEGLRRRIESAIQGANRTRIGFKLLESYLGD